MQSEPSISLSNIEGEEYSSRHFSFQDSVSKYIGLFSGIELLESAVLNAGESHREQAQKEYRTALASCVTDFKDKPECQNHDKFITLCIKHADLSEDPLDVFRGLYQSGVGHSAALFWGSWGWAAEQASDYAQAAKIYNMGVRCGAKPDDILQECIEGFKERVHATIRQLNQQHQFEKTEVKDQENLSTQEDQSLKNRPVQISLITPHRQKEQCKRKSRPIIIFEDRPKTGGNTSSVDSKKKINSMTSKRPPLVQINQNIMRPQQGGNGAAAAATHSNKRLKTSTCSSVFSEDFSFPSEQTPKSSTARSSKHDTTIHPTRRARRRTRCSLSPLVVNPFEPRHREMMTVKSVGLEKWMEHTKKVVDIRENEEQIGQKLAWPKKYSASRRYTTYKLGKHRIHIHSELGSGAYGVVFCCKMINHKSKGGEFAVKVERPPQLLVWECFILDQISGKMQSSAGVGYEDLVLISPKALYLYDDASAMVMSKESHGTLHDLVTAYFKVGIVLQELVIMHYTIEMIRWVELLLSCGILHCDIKTDNWLVTRKRRKQNTTEKRGKLAGIEHSISLIDFGKSIDLKMYNKVVQFEGTCTAKSFECIEMREKRPWKHQVDTYGLLSCVHFMLFGSFMTVEAIPIKRTENNSEFGLRNLSERYYMPSKPFKRYWQRHLWQGFFRSLLNMEEKESLATLLSHLRSKFEHYVYDNQANYETLQMHLARETQYTKPSSK